MTGIFLLWCGAWIWSENGRLAPPPDTHTSVTSVGASFPICQSWSTQVHIQLRPLMSCLLLSLEVDVLFFIPRVLARGNILIRIYCYGSLTRAIFRWDFGLVFLRFVPVSNEIWGGVGENNIFCTLDEVERSGVEHSGFDASPRIHAAKNLAISAEPLGSRSSVYFMRVTPSSLVHAIIKWLIGMEIVSHACCSGFSFVIMQKEPSQYQFWLWSSKPPDLWEKPFLLFYKWLSISVLK